MKNIKILFLSLLVVSPVMTFAALGGVKDLLISTKDIIDNIAIPILFGIALIYFFWGLIQFIRTAGEEKTREEGKQKMLWGVIALFVFVSIYGILSFISGTINIKMGGTYTSGGSSSNTDNTGACTDPFNCGQ